MLKSKLKGFTLSELLIAVAINSLLFVALISLFTANLNYFQTATKSDKLSQQLQVAMDIMATDIRRAGYWFNAQSDLGLHQNNNPFQNAINDIRINSAANCILFTYDRNDNGAVPAIDASIDDEHYGFRLISGALQARPPGAVYSCDAPASAWENINNPNETLITALNFTLTTRTITTGSGTRALNMRSVDITMTGQLTSDSSVTKTLTQRVHLRNDKYIP